MATTRKSPARPSARKASPRTATRKAARPSTPDRDSHPRDSRGRFKADHHVRNVAVGTAAAIGAVAAGVAAAFRFGLLDRFLPASANDLGGHAAEDLLIDDGDAADASARPAGRAPAAFRPDMNAPMTAGERDALRPAKGQRAVELAGAGNGAVESV